MNRQLKQQEQMTSPYGPIGGIRATGGNAATRDDYSHYYPSKNGQVASRNYKIRGLSKTAVGANATMGGMRGGMGGGF
jgi:hypothetical protein